MTASLHRESAEAATVAGAVEALMETTVLSVNRMPAGEVNRVYKVEAEGRALVVKVFRYRGWPEDGKLQCVERRLTEHRVPHSRLLYITRDDALFPHGFAVSEYVEGRDCAAALAGGSLSLEDYCRGVGDLLKKVHAIKFDRFGYIGHGSGTDEDFIEAKLAYEVNDRLREVDPSALPAGDLPSRIEDKVRRLLAPFTRRFAPVLVHSDAAPKNAILTAGGQFVLTDWDEAVAAVWLEDYAKLTYLLFYTHHSLSPDPETKKVVSDAFFGGYGQSDFGMDEVAAIEDALHTVQAADHLSYYFKTGDAAGLEWTKELLLRLL